MIQLCHPLGVSLGEIIVHRDEMDAFPFQRVQIDGQRRDQGFPLSGFHLGNAAAMENHTADQLHIEMSHVECAPRHFPAYGESFWQDIVQCLTRLKSLLEVLCLVSQRLIGKRCKTRLQPIDLVHDRTQGLDFTVVFTAEYQIEYLCNHSGNMK